MAAVQPWRGEVHCGVCSEKHPKRGREGLQEGEGEEELPPVWLLSISKVISCSGML